MNALPYILPTWLTFVGPTSFTDKVGWVDAGADHIWTDRYCVISCGLPGLCLAIY